VILNGDIDNYLSLREALEKKGDLIAPELTTDTKIIPLQIEKYLVEGHDLTEAFRLAVGDFEGSHAIAMISNLDPEKAFLAIRGSGQAIYIGLAADSYIFSSEVYGLVECTARFLKMDGEKPSRPGIENGTGQIFILNSASNGGLSGIRAICYDGTPLTLEEEPVQTAEITTRDIDRGIYPHYFLKEITESSLSVRKTLRGKYRIQSENGRRQVIFNLGPDILPDSIRNALRSKEIRFITVVGQGTAAVAASAVADGFERYLRGTEISSQAQIATELSGFCLRDDLRDTLVIPITQSGTTTDTNRAVIMASERGASIVAIVNRRQSDITTRSHGVFYTSDGRDIEMSVASTKAFYSQIIAGHILALCIAQIMGTISDDDIAGELLNLEQTPAAMARVMETQEEIRLSVEKFAKYKPYWAVVGSGPNKAAADEIRIKLSELCYKTISTDVVENKKHIDLSAEPLIIVCAAGNPEAVMGDIVKDIAIFKAHKAGIIAFADEGETRLAGSADTVIEIPRMPQPLPVILNTLCGHLWGYYAARSINDDALILRTFRNHLNQALIEQRKAHISFYDRMADRQFRQLIRDFTIQFHEHRKFGSFAFAGSKTISDILLLLKYVAGKLPLEDFWLDFPEDSEISSPTDLLDITLGHAIDELSRPIDAIRHQAKTVTVGTSRKEIPPQGLLFDLLKELGFSTHAIFSRNIPVINRIQLAVLMIRGYTLYDLHDLDAEGSVINGATISIRQRGGVSLQMSSRIQGIKALMGTKRTIAQTGSVYAGFGKSDNTQIVIIPLIGEHGGVQHLLLMHVTFNEAMPVIAKKGILGEKYNDIKNLVNEYNLPWEDAYLEFMPTASLLGEPVEVLAGQIRQYIESK
jgi:glucosamine--fructose-6-phosphate aminotransferase (isomerizing)